MKIQLLYLLAQLIAKKEMMNLVKFLELTVAASIQWDLIMEYWLTVTLVHSNKTFPKLNKLQKGCSLFLSSKKGFSNPFE